MHQQGHLALADIIGHRYTLYGHYLHDFGRHGLRHHIHFTYTRHYESVICVDINRGSAALWVDFVRSYAQSGLYLGQTAEVGGDMLQVS